MLNAVIVGVGWWGKHIIGCLHNSPKIRITQALDLEPDSIREFASGFDISVGTDYHRALEDLDIDAVILTTPHDEHEPQVIAAARAGKHVFCEKPLCLTRASAARAIDACDAAGVSLGVGHERRFEPALIEIRRMVETGELGRIMHVESNFSHDKQAAMTADNWRVGAGETPAVAMTGMGIHLTDAYLDMFGSIVEIYAQTAQRVVPFDSGDVVSVQLRFASGATGYFSAIMATPLFLRYQVFGSRAWVEARNQTHPDSKGVTLLTVNRSDADPVTTTFEWVDTVRANLHAFADEITGDGNYPFSAEQKLDNIAVLEGICDSARQGKVHQLN
jgi:predicted dehydrogenase